MSASDNSIDLERTLRERFGLERFRAGQREVIEAVLGHRDVLCVMPTGGGKSLCYQLPALLLEGLTVVVSPLIALMKDQVDALVQRGIRATLINSTLDPAEQRARLSELEFGQYDLVYVAPERFRSGRFVEAMARIKPALLAVDEAHCISEWGHDFRPDYARLGQARRALGKPPCIALTATATDLVRRDIADQLDLHDPSQFVTGFDRPNLSYRAIEARKDAEKLAALAEVLRRNPGPAIVYASSRKRCEDVGAFLGRELRREAVIYHAGLERDQRTNAQDRFMSGEVDVVVATNAFGMGVDKADIRSVVHFNMPGTLEAYYQEAGRAGRDGLPAECVLLHAFGDRFLQELFIENEYPPREVVFRVYEYLRTLDADPIELTQAEIREAIGIEQSEQAVGTSLRILEGDGALERFRPRENMAIVRINAEADEPSLVERLNPQANVQRLVMTALEGLVNRRVGEPVYFRPDDFATAIGLDRAALTRAIRNLAAELPIDYIPPFRGNAVRIMDRARRARDLGIDFSELERRKRQEYDKLEIMVKYAQSAKCRRSYILGYFGDSETSRCGRCDNCGPASGPGSGPAVEVATAAGREVILKALSGVARMRGRFGKTVVAQMLAGSGSEKMTRWGLTRLSTFGLLGRGGFTQAEVVQLLDALTTAGLIESEEVDRFKPVVKLSESGWAYVRGREAAPIGLALPEYLAAKVNNGGLERLAPSGRPVAPRPISFDEPDELPELPDDEPEAIGPPADDGADGDLIERLRRLRSQWARESNMSPGYVLSNETIEALARERPRTPHALAAIKGIGPSKLERFGGALLEAIVAAGPTSVATVTRIEEAPRPGPPPEGEPSSLREPARAKAPVVPAAAPGPGGYVATEEWTWRLLDRGFTLDEAAAIRGLEPSAIVRHATWVARQGRPVPLESFLTSEAIARWDAWHRDHGASPPSDPDADRGLWPLYLACRRGE